jgi:flagellar biosynthesis protein FlhF
MRLKSFHGPSLNDAMRLVREALGENAIIVATRDDEMGGVRVTAAVEDAPPATEPAKPRVPEQTGSDVIEIIATSLLKHHVPNALAERLLATATQVASDDPLLALGAALDTHFQYKTLADDPKGQPVMLIGPPGAGKTLCTAKLATKASLAKKPVTVFSTDTTKAGGLEQLQAFTRLLKTDLLQIEDAHALSDALKMQQAKTLALIDTAGTNPFANDDRQQLQAFVQAAAADTVLVLPAGIDASEAIDLIGEFRRLGAASLLLTHLDITRRLGPMLRAAFEARIPLGHYSASPKVTEAPQPLNPVVLARMILPPPATRQSQPQATGTHA